MFKHSFSTKVKIEIVEKRLSENSLWITEYKPWKDVWACISIKYISSKRALYLFEIKWHKDFPKEFRVIIQDKIFTPTQSPIIEPSNNLILFHSIISQ